MPLPHSKTTGPTPSSLGRLGADACLSAPPRGPNRRASETYDQADAWSEDVLRREFGDPSGLGIAFAEPGEMERRNRDEFWPHAIRRDRSILFTMGAYFAAAVVAAFVAYPLVQDWLR